MTRRSIHLPEAMDDEIDDRRDTRTSRSEWIRNAIRARFDAEDRGDWDEFRRDSNDGADEAEAPR